MPEDLNRSEGDTNRLIDEFLHLHLDLVGLIDKVRPEDRQRILFDKWSLKDVLVHITAWNDLNTARATSVTQGAQPADLIPDDELDLFNERELAKRKALSWDEIYEGFSASGQRVASAFSTIPNNHWDTEFGEGDKRYTMREFLRDAVGHYRNEHIPQLQSFLNPQTK